MLRKPIETLSAHTRVELDLEVFASRAARYREGRRVNGVIRSAQSSSKQTAPGKSCLSNGPREEKSVRFDSSTSESASSTTDLQPAHWIDGLHEPDGTHPSLVVSGENEKHEDRVRRAIHELTELGRPRQLTVHRVQARKSWSSSFTQAKTQAQIYWLDI